MTIISACKRAMLGASAIALIGFALPAAAQKPTEAEMRLRKIEAEVSALQRQVFPGGDAKYFPPEIQKAPAAAVTTGTPATTPVTDLLTRMDSVEAQLSRLTAQGEENGNRIAQIEAKLAAMAPPPAPAPAPTPAAAAPAVVAPALSVPAAGVPVPKPSITSANLAPAPAKPAAAATPKADAPSPKRVAAVKAIQKPATDDPGDDEYSYGYRLWEAKFYPEAEQQLQLFLTKYPKHERVSFARNLMGRALLDEGKPRDAAQWFLKNYQSDKKGARAPDSLLLLGESMRQLSDVKRACIALGEFADSYAAEAAGRLKTQYEQTRAGVKCN